jgi:hypothetical protein
VSRTDTERWELLTELDSDRRSLPFGGAPGTGGVHQNAPHHLRSHRKEVCLVLPAQATGTHQPQVGFVREGCRL